MSRDTPPETIPELHELLFGQDLQTVIGNISKVRQFWKLLPNYFIRKELFSNWVQTHPHILIGSPFIDDEDIVQLTISAKEELVLFISVKLALSDKFSQLYHKHLTNNPTSKVNPILIEHFEIIQKHFPPQPKKKQEFPEENIQKSTSPQHQERNIINSLRGVSTTRGRGRGRGRGYAFNKD